MNTVIICSECGQGNYRRAEDLHAATDAQYVCDNPACESEANDRDFTWELEPDETLVLDEGRVAYLKAAQRPNPFSETSTTTADDVRAVAYIVEDIEALGIRVICDAKRSASCRDYIETGALQIYNARIIARHEGWDTTPEVPRRDICPACIEHAQRAGVGMSVVTPTRGTAFIGPDGTLQRVVDSARPSPYCPDGIVLYGPDTDSAVICGGSRATWAQVQAWMDATEVPA